MCRPIKWPPPHIHHILTYACRDNCSSYSFQWRLFFLSLSSSLSSPLPPSRPPTRRHTPPTHLGNRLPASFTRPARRHVTPPHAKPGCPSPITCLPTPPFCRSSNPPCRRPRRIWTGWGHGSGYPEVLLRGNKNRSTAARNCLEVVSYSAYRINQVGGALSGGGLKDARAWMSAALAYQYDCWSGLKYVNDTSQVVQTMAFFNNSLIAGTSSALGMLVNYDVYGDKTGSWGPPRTERDGFWEPGSDSRTPRWVGRLPAGLKADVTVCKGGGGCNYKTVQEAVNAAPTNGKRFVIRIKAGVYEETVRVALEKKNVVLLGDGMGKTVITGSMNVGQPGVSTYNSATVGVLGDGFMASDLTIQNTAGPDAHQAVAFRSDSDRSVLQNCEFIGNQDTLYAHSLRQYYKSCRIIGQRRLHIRKLSCILPGLPHPRCSKATPSRKGREKRLDSPRQDRPRPVDRLRLPELRDQWPWKQYSRTVFIRCTLEALVTADGWLPWDGDFALNTLYYGEFENTGLVLTRRDVCRGVARFRPPTSTRTRFRISFKGSSGSWSF
ncbi:UNVERIFIED_CONTAM: putative pectinesterase/pectinesterase inhibitor 64 [Sesamum calycinum]|uniref:Pectinesterase/pectinesterase inhibitor 64 n=1 Tax=Sesamum calycinum TaxID=2727403 RepID=A0AAW2MPI9_9LAMI